jgi:peptide/nickel transport system permease protein
MTEEKSIFFLIAIFGLLGWPNVARNMRTEMLRTRSQEFIESARALGYSHFRIMVRHAIPNCMSPVMVVLTFGVASTIVAEAALSFLGIGVPDDVMTWGGLLYSAKSNGSAWWLSVFPGMAIFLTATSLNLVGEGIRDALDPRVQYEK